MIWQQRWRNVLFLHFPVDQRELAARLPRQLALDLFDGQAWLSYIFFRLQLRPAWLPSIPGLSSLLELNVRTYVRHLGQSGIYFLRMYADNHLAITAARWLTPLRYEQARLLNEPTGDGRCHVECRPRMTGGATLSADFECNRCFDRLLADSLDAWLVERYRLFTESIDGRMLTVEVQHVPWLAAGAQLTRFDDSLSQSHGVTLPTRPVLAHYSPGLAARFNAFEVATDNGASSAPLRRRASPATAALRAQRGAW